MIDYGMIRQKFYWISAALLIISALTIYSFYEDRVSMPRLYQSSAMHQIHLRHKEGNAVTWELSADRAIFPTDKKEVYLKSIGIRINRDPAISLSGGNGVYEIEKEEITLAPPVEVEMNGARFTTRSIKFNNKSETVTTDDAVRYSGKDFVIEGKGLIASIKQNEIRIVNDVKATFYR